MCEQLKSELDAGQKAATALASHLEDMGAGAATLAVHFNGTDYLVSIRPKDHAPDMLVCPSCMANVKEINGELMYVSSADNIDPNQPKGHAN